MSAETECKVIVHMLLKLATDATGFCISILFFSKRKKKPQKTDLGGRNGNTERFNIPNFLMLGYFESKTLRSSKPWEGGLCCRFLLLFEGIRA